MDQWNVRPPVLYLWSRHDWADKHKAIAQEHGHLCPSKQEELEKGKTSDTLRVRQPVESEKGKISDLSRLRQQEDSGIIGKGSETSRPKQLESEKGQSSKTSDDHIHLNDTFLMKESTMLADEPEDSKSGSVVSEFHKNGSTKPSKKDSDRESRDSRDRCPNLSPEVPCKRPRFEDRPRRGDGETSEESRRDSKRPPLDEINQRPHASPNVSDHRSSLDGFLSTSVEMPPYAEVGGTGHQQSGSTMPGSNANFGADYDAARTSSTMPGPNANFGTDYDAVRTSSTMPGPNANFGVDYDAARTSSTMPRPNANFGFAYDAAQTSSTDDIARKYNLNAEDPYSTGTGGWSYNVSPISDIGSRHFEERTMDHMGGHVDALNYKPYTTGLDGYVRESEIRSHYRHYGHLDTDNLRSNYQAGPDPGYSRIGSFPTTYGHLGTTPESSHWMNTSATQRYAPRLDELNHSRLGGMGAGHPMNGSGAFDPRAHLPPGMRGAPQGFASGPQYPYSNQNSAGWLNE